MPDPTQTWICTALPNGAETIDGRDYLKVSLVFSPRLHVPRLTEEWRRWPLTVENLLRFGCVLAASDANGNPDLSKTRHFVEGADDPCRLMLRDRRLEKDPQFEIREAARSWRLLFNRNTLEAVRGKVPVIPTQIRRAVICDIPQLHTKSVRQAETAQEVQATYTGKGRCEVPGVPPAAAAADGEPDDGAPGAASEETTRLTTERLEPKETVKIGIGKTAELIRDFDFHQRITVLSDYPALMRLFRIVVDVLIPWVPRELKDWNFNHLWLWPMAAHVDELSPGTRWAPIRTACRMTFAGARPDLFAVREDDGISYGPTLVNAGASRFKIQTVDAVSAALKLRSMAAGQGSSDELPALRTTGMTILIDRAKEDLQGAMDRQSDLDAQLDQAFAIPGYGVMPEADAAAPPTAAPPVIAWLDQLTAGHRVRVARKPNDAKQPDAWLSSWSLCKRDCRYEFADAKRKPIERLIDEGMISDAHAKRDAKTVVVSDSLATWVGWSLCVPRPGHEMDLSQKILDQHNRLPNVERLPLDVHFSRVKESLHPLRIGDQYRLNVEPVDPAGNTIPIAPRNEACPCKCGKSRDACAKGTIQFRRAEPVPAPILLRASARQAAESLREMVVFTAPREASADPEFVKTLERHVPVRWVLPPPTSGRLAEWHGLFDRQTAQRAYDLQRQRTCVPAEPDEHLSSVADALKIPPEPKFPLTYLPDPMGYRVECVLLIDQEIGKDPTPCGLPQVIHFGDARPGFWKRDWQRWKPWRLELRRASEGSAPSLANFDPDDRVLRVYLPRGRTGVVRLRCLPTGADRREYFEAQSWFEDAESERLLNLIAPPVHITLTHAALRPFPARVTASFGRRLKNAAGQPLRLAATRAGASMPLELDTQSVELVARIEQQVDDLDAGWINTGPGAAGPPIKTIVQRLALSSLKEEQPATLTAPLTRAYRVRLRCESSSRYARLFVDQRMASQRDAALNAVTAGELVVSQDSIGLSGLESDDPMIGKPAAEVGCWLRSTCPPPPPEIAYIVPLILPHGQTSSSAARRRSGFRVYLKRPWFQSGADEKLAVVCRPPEPRNNPLPYLTYLTERLKGLVTEWGGDPIREKLKGGVDGPSPMGFGPAVHEFVGRSILPNAAPELIPLELRDAVRPLPPPNPARPVVLCDIPAPRVVCDIPAPDGVVRCDLGNPPPVVLLAPYDVHQSDQNFGGERLCYADIILESDKLDDHYFPFIRLALARYQPHSWAPEGDPSLGVHMSQVALAEFMMLPAGRSLEARANSTRDRITVRLHGAQAAAYVDRATQPGTDPKTQRGVKPSKIHVSVEEAATTGDGAAAWTPTGVEACGFHDTGTDCVVEMNHAPTDGVSRRVVVRELERYLDARHQESDRCVLIRTLSL